MYCIRCEVWVYADSDPQEIQDLADEHVTTHVENCTHEGPCPIYRVHRAEGV